jgi:hypothetical protein
MPLNRFGGTAPITTGELSGNIFDEATRPRCAGIGRSPGITAIIDCISGGNALSFPRGTLHLTGAAMFAPEIFGFPSSALWSLMQALLTPALGFAFLYLMGLPFLEFSFLPKTQYTPPRWVVPLFAHGLIFALVLLLSTNVFLNRTHEQNLANAISPEFFLVRELDVEGKRLAKVALLLTNYDGFSRFKIFANSYHVFSSDRDCVASFQCTSNVEKARNEAEEFNKNRLSGGSLYELNLTNSLPQELVLTHYLARERNYIDIVSENAGTGDCELSMELVLATHENLQERYGIEILPQRNPVEAQEPARRGPLLSRERFYSGGPKFGDTIDRYKTPTLERRNVVCETIRISMKLSAGQAQDLSGDAAFESYFLTWQKDFVCATLGKPPPQGCESTP